MKYLAAITAAALIASFAAASAQSPGAGMSGTTQNQTQCWDISTNTVKNRAPAADMTGAKDQTTTGAAASGSSAGVAQSGSPTTGSAGSATSTSGSMSGSGSARPAGMGAC